MWPFDVLGGIFEEFLKFREIKPSEAQGEFERERLILVYASTLPMDTLPIIIFFVFLWANYLKSLARLVQDNRSEKGELTDNYFFIVENFETLERLRWNTPSPTQLKQEHRNKRVFILLGQAVMVDFIEDGLPALIGGEHVELQVFVVVLPYSDYTFAYPTPD